MTSIQYLKYIIRHKWYVFVECCKMGIIWRGLIHDLSKLTLKEFVPYRGAFYGKYGYKFNPDDVEYVPDGFTIGQIRNRRISNHEEVMKAFDCAWLYHQHRNPHHWQYWVLREDCGDIKYLEMPDIYIKELVCDWIGAGKAIMGKDANALKWYEKNKSKILMNDNTRNKVEFMLTRIYDVYIQKP